MEYALILALQWYLVEEGVRIDPVPQVYVISDKEAHDMFGGSVYGLYVKSTREVYISDSVDLSTPFGASVLVHELYHHIQNITAVKHDCLAEYEREPMLAQRRYLEYVGAKIHPILSPFNIMSRSTCMEY